MAGAEQTDFWTHIHERIAKREMPSSNKGDLHLPII